MKKPAANKEEKWVLCHREELPPFFSHYPFTSSGDHPYIARRWLLSEVILEGKNKGKQRERLVVGEPLYLHDINTLAVSLAEIAVQANRALLALLQRERPECE